MVVLMQIVKIQTIKMFFTFERVNKTELYQLKNARKEMFVL